MDWQNLHDATSQNEKPVPGWLFRDICRGAQQHPQDIPDVAEYIMRCVACDNQNVSLKACLTMRHLADDVPQFRDYMQRCPEALAILKDVCCPPPLAITASIEPPEAKIFREAAARALKSCTSQTSQEAERKAQVQARIQGFGNYSPPEEEQPRQGAQGAADKVASFVGDALADTVDDFREKGAIGAVRDGVLDAADLLADGVGAVWSFLGGRRNAPAPAVQERICKPRGEGFAGAGGLSVYPGAVPMPHVAPTPGVALATVPMAPADPTARYSGAFGQGAVGAGYSFSPGTLQQMGLGAPMPQPPLLPQQPPANSEPSALAAGSPAEHVATCPAPELEDLLDFEDEIEPVSSVPDLLDFGDQTCSGASSSVSAGFPAQVEELKSTGNALVKERRFDDALRQYEAALALLEHGSHGALRATLFANIALCYLQQQLYRRAVEAATKSIQADPTNAKAYYRRCLAHRALKMYNEARRDFESLGGCRHEMRPSEVQRLAASLHVAQ